MVTDVNNSIPFELTGLSNIPNILATLVIFFVGGVFAEKTTMWISNKRGGREAEYQLPNLILPVILAVIGSMVFGVADQYSLHYMVLLTGSFLMLLAPLLTGPVIQNFIMESYPQWAGYVDMGEEDWIIDTDNPFPDRCSPTYRRCGFLLASFSTRKPPLGSQCSVRIASRTDGQVYANFSGPVNFMGYVSLVLVIVAGTGIPLLFLYGKDLRRWTSGQVKKRPQQKWAGDEP